MENGEIMIDLPDSKEIISELNSIITTFEQNQDVSYSEMIKISTKLYAIRDKIKILKNIPISKELLDQFKEKEDKLNQIFIRSLNRK